MPFLFKLSNRVARMRSSALLLAVAATLAACEAGDPSSLSAPTHPSFVTSTGAPAAVTDLVAAAMTDSSATLTFTDVDDGTVAPASYDIRDVPGMSISQGGSTLGFAEVGDGAGRRASYDVRYAAGSPITWGASVPSVSRGTCATPVAGTSIGAKRACTVLGLTPGTTYSVELVAYRGTLNVNAVFGALSNVASGATAAAGSTPAAVVTVGVSPAAPSVAVGQTLPLTATAKDSAGNVLSGRPVSWASSNGSVATVSGAGLVTGVAAGGGARTAPRGGGRGGAAGGVPPPPPAAQPNLAPCPR